MRAALVLDKSGLDDLVKKFEDPLIRDELNRIPQRRAIAALVAQAIADNFAQEGPGWAPLKPETIRRSVAKALKKKLDSMTDAQLVAHEKKARASGKEPHRSILRRSSLLYNTVTTPQYSGANKEGQHGKNIYKVEGSKLIWGTDLIYAGVHNSGFPKRNIPKREFLTIRDNWMKQLTGYIIDEAFKIIVQKILKGNT